MREIKLTKGMVALVDDEDYDWLNQWKWCAHRYTGCNSHYADRNDYKKIGTKKKAISVKMHRLIMGVTDPNIFVDHIDKNGLNNQRSNLRLATRSQNAANRVPWKTKSSRFLGVTLTSHTAKKKWHAQLTQKGKCRSLGLFEKEEDAALAYNNAAIIAHGEFASLNDV